MKTESETAPLHRGGKVGFGGIAVGGAAVLLTLVHTFAGPFAPQPSLEQVVAERIVSVREAASRALRGEELVTQSVTSSWNADRVAVLLAMVLGGLALILGVLSFAMREPRQVALGAGILGLSAIALQYLLIALAALVLAAVVGAAISQLGLLD